MKKIYTLTFLLFSLSAIAQEEVSFKSVHIPNKVYTTSMFSLTKSEMSFSGSEEKMQNLIDNGYKSPIVYRGSNEIVATTVTAERTKEGNIPVRITYDKVKMVHNMDGEDKEEENAMTGMIIEGYYNSNNKLHVDTMISEKVADYIKTSIKSTLENVTEVIDFPEHAMHIGDTFLQKVPMQIPLAGLNPMNIEVVSLYKLISIHKGIAMFDIIQDVTFDTQNNNTNMNATGRGIGTLEYDVEKYNINKFETELNMNMKIETEGLTIDSKITSLTKLNIKVE